MNGPLLAGATRSAFVRGLILGSWVVPWLTPFASGPSSAVQPWLACLACLGILLALRDRIQPADLVWGWLVAATVSAVLGLVQYFGASGPLAPWVNVSELGTAFGNLRQRNQFGTLTNIGVLALWCLVRSRAPLLGDAWGMGASVLLAMLLGTANAASASRTALVQLLLLGVVLWPWRKRDDFALTVIAASWIGYAAAIFLLPALAGLDLTEQGILGRFREGASCFSRQVLWSNVMHLITLRPLVGWGWGELDFAHYVTLYPGARFCDILDNAHNIALHVAVELGVPVASAVVIATLTALVRAKPWVEQDPIRACAWLVLALIGFHSMLEYPLWYGPFVLATMASFVLLRPVPNVRRPSGGQVFVSAFAAALIGLAAYAAWDYHRISQIYLPAESRSPAYRDNTLAKIQDSWLFRDQVRFAELTLTSVTRENAAHMEALALDLLHFSPEPRVIEKLIEAAVLLGHDDLAKFHMVRFRAAFPDAYAKWLLSGAQTPAT